MDDLKRVLGGRARRIAAAGLLLTLALPQVFAQGLAIGSAMPSFSVSGGGRTVTSGGFGGKKAVVVVFVDNHCTYSQAYEGRLSHLESEYRPQGVEFVLINPNPVPGVASTYLADVNQNAVRAFGATRTPEVFVFGADRKLIYRGQIDDNTEERMVRHGNLKLALDSILKGTPELIERPVTSSFGCSIKPGR